MNRYRNLLLAGVAAVTLSTAAMAKDTGLIFVSSEKDNAVYVLDGKTYAPVKTIPTAARPRHLQFDPERNRIFVACGRGNAIDIIDVAKLELVDRIANVEDPELFDFSKDGRTLYISLEEDAALGILDLETHFAEREGMPELATAEPEAGDGGDEEEEGEEGEEEGEEEAVPGLSTVETGEEPEGVLANPDGKTVYVTSEVANIVHVVDLASRQIRANVVAGNRPRRFALTPDGKQLWVTNELNATVTVIDTATDKVTGTIEFPPPTGARSEQVTPVGIVMTRDGATAVVALGRANHIAFVDAKTLEVGDYVLVGQRAWNMTFNRDESLLFVANGLSDDMTIIDAASRKPLKSVPVGRVPHTVLIDD
ncbi:MAG: beta-propeller fold lactonase family protein [Minwuia sp.]|uniref:beta-propeller fold lactonase family protein n=1 Tax=Minwuia sp. TaxID=2493630 RepID=UPI003A8A1F11